MSGRALLLVVVALGLAGCRHERAPAAAGAPVRRIVSLAPSTTEILFALGAGERIVGVDQFSDYPPAARALPTVGNELTPSVERILALRPDVVFVATSANDKELVEQLTRLGVRVVISHAETLDDVWRDIANIGAAVGRDEAAARLVAAGRARLAAVARRVAGLPRPRTLVVVWPEPLTVAGGHTFVDEAIRVAGGEDVAGDSPLPYPQYSLERLLARAPEVIVVGSHAQAPSLAPIEAQRSLPAVRQHRVHAVDGDLLFRPGPRLVDGIEQLAKLVHPLIRCAGVSYAYGAPLLQDIDVELGAGELVGVVGPNGAGKSTLARLLLGLVAPQAGRVTAAGRDLSSLPPRERARLVAAVLQDEPLEFPFRALEVVLMGRRARLGPFGFERAADVAAAEAAMRDTGVLELAHRPLAELSGGERKRVLLARALAQDTPVLVLDEPTAALDLRHQLDLFRLLDARRRAGAAIAAVVHDLNLAAAWCTRIVLLAPGAPAVVGSVDEVLTEARIRAAFAVEVTTGRHPRSGARVLFPS